MVGYLRRFKNCGQRRSSPLTGSALGKTDSASVFFGIRLKMGL